MSYVSKSYKTKNTVLRRLIYKENFDLTFKCTG